MWRFLALRHYTTLFLVGVRTRSLVVIEGESAFPSRCLLVGAFPSSHLREECLDLFFEENAYIYDEEEPDNT